MRTVIELTTGWQFGMAVSAEGNTLPVLPETMEAVTIPHVWNAVAPAKTGKAVYQYRFQRESVGEQVFVEFGAVANVCKVWLNEAFIGEHRGGYSCFRFALTEALQDGENTLTVLADNKKYEDSNPLGGDFNAYGGIYREVSLISTGKNHFDLLHFGSSGLDVETHVDGTVLVSSHVVGEGTVVYTLLEGNKIAAQAEGNTARMQVENPHLWNGREDPFLYTLRADLMVDGVCQDSVSLNCGFRECRIDPDKGFYLNGKYIKLNGVAKHQDREGVGNRPSKAQLDEDMALILEVGANAIRLSHYQHPQYFYDLCDKYGLLVWAEIPMLGMPDGNKVVVENAKQQMQELIAQSKHHPSIFAWGIWNEITMYGESLELYDKADEINRHTKPLDPSRFTTAANLFSVKFSSQLNFIPDILGYNVYFGWYHHEMSDYDPFLEQFHAENPQVPLGISEYGVDGNPALHSATPQRKDYSEEFQALFHETVYPKLRDRRFIWGSFVWNMFDFGSALRNEGGSVGRNCKGLVTFDRKLRKDAFYYYKANWSKDPFVHIGGRRFANRCGEDTTVKVYTNQNKVRIFVNGKIFQEILSSAPVYTFEHVPLQPGENVICAAAGDLKEEIVLNRVSEPDQSYVYVDPNPEYNVRNWFTAEESEEDLFSPDRYSIMVSMKELMADPNVTVLLEKEAPEIYEECVSAKLAPIPLLRIINSRRTEFSEDYAKDLNKKLRTVKKPGK